MSSNTCNDAPEKIGLDDYCDREGKNAAEAFMKLPEEDYAESKEIWKLSERLAFVDELGCVYDFEAKRFYKSKAELIYVFADRLVKVQKADSSFRAVNAAELGLKWPHKRRYKGICYAPGKASNAGS